MNCTHPSCTEPGRWYICPRPRGSAADEDTARIAALCPLHLEWAVERAAEAGFRAEVWPCASDG